jgi:hypothetical protein
LSAERQQELTLGTSGTDNVPDDGGSSLPEDLANFWQKHLLMMTVFARFNNACG